MIGDLNSTEYILEEVSRKLVMWHWFWFWFLDHDDHYTWGF
jgi:hypothetical protein